MKNNIIILIKKSILLFIGIMIFHLLVTFNLTAQNKNETLIGTRLLAKQVTEINPELLRSPWPAKWISYPDQENTGYGVYLFRKEISIKARPEKFSIHVSADDRYKLYINGVYVWNGVERQLKERINNINNY
ncbi:hypothetical protein GALL_167790 [mine drainage metagenome]|uniref:Uncharacterized protein n=1 Tax=mine drainage metagenome TaxID=410659 RepID=A0A1J5RZ60_9ZZZZ